MIVDDELGDVLVLISYMEELKSFLKTARVAKNNKIKTIANNFHSPLARLSNIALHVDAPLENSSYPNDISLSSCDY